MEFFKDQLLLYAITDPSSAGKETVYRQVEMALKGGVTMVQFREKNGDEETLTAQAVELRKLCHRYGVPLLINDSVRVALKSGADGVHVGAKDTPVSDIRKLTGKDFIIGATAKTVEQARFAERSGADYLGVGAVFPSKTKTDAIRITVDRLREICSSVNIPAVAIGGISLENLPELKGGGMAGIAVVSALFASEDICRAAQRLKVGARDVVGA